MLEHSISGKVYYNANLTSTGECSDYVQTEGNFDNVQSNHVQCVQKKAPASCSLRNRCVQRSTKEAPAGCYIHKANNPDNLITNHYIYNAIDESSVKCSEDYPCVTKDGVDMEGVDYVVTISDICGKGECETEYGVGSDFIGLPRLTLNFDECQTFANNNNYGFSITSESWGSRGEADPRGCLWYNGAVYWNDHPSSMFPCKDNVGCLEKQRPADMSVSIDECKAYAARKGKAFLCLYMRQETREAVLHNRVEKKDLQPSTTILIRIH